MTLKNNPYEVGLGWLVELEQEADFIGKEALRRIKAEGIKRKLVGVEIHGDRLPGWPEEFWPVYEKGEEIGHMTAAVYSPGLKKNIGYALLSIEHARWGTALEIDTPWGTADATVVRKPFVDHKKEIPKKVFHTR
jgi:aminomethyltransferase